MESFAAAWRVTLALRILVMPTFPQRANSWVALASTQRRSRTDPQRPSSRLARMRPVAAAKAGEFGIGRKAMERR